MSLVRSPPPPDERVVDWLPAPPKLLTSGLSSSSSSSPSLSPVSPVATASASWSS